MGLYSFHLFAGAGGGSLADILLGHTPVGAVEIEEYPRKVLLQRQRDGVLPPFPIWNDVRSFRSDNRETGPYVQRLKDVASELIISGGFPCQDISCAGKGAGLSGARSGLWSEMARIIGEVRPRYVFVENSPVLVSRGLEVCLSDLAAMGYDARWGVIGADDAGAPHRRKRIWIVADSMRERSGPRRAECAGQCGRGTLEQSGYVAHSQCAERRQNDRPGQDNGADIIQCGGQEDSDRPQRSGQEVADPKKRDRHNVRGAGALRDVERDGNRTTKLSGLRRQTKEKTNDTM